MSLVQKRMDFSRKWSILFSSLSKGNTKFFASINHGVLLDILREYISDQAVVWLLKKVIDSFDNHHIEQQTHDRGFVVKNAKGLPLGNLTSQLFCNIYMNELDQFVKYKLKAKYYSRYDDDFVLLSNDKAWLLKQIPVISNFLETKLKLSLHPEKVMIKTLASGVDFLGWVHFPKHRRTADSDQTKNV